jgi:hypothetical protein
MTTVKPLIAASVMMAMMKANLSFMSLREDVVDQAEECAHIEPDNRE